MKITVMEHRQWLRRTHHGLTVLLERGTTHVRVKPSRLKKDGHDYAQIEINYAIKKLKEKDEK